MDEHLSESIVKRLEGTILAVAKERGVVMGVVAANHMAIDILQAIRKPTKAMVNAGLHWQSHCSDVDSLFEQMIDAALHGESLPPHPDLRLYESTD
jgi:hypothetical protein